MTNGKQRKAWRADLKWLFGLLATFLLTVSLTSFAMYRITADSEINKANKKLAIEQLNIGSDQQKKSFDNKSPASMPDIKIKIGDKEFSADVLQKMDPKGLQELMKEFGMDKEPQSGGKGSSEGREKGSPPDKHDMPEMSGPDKMSEMFGEQMNQMVGPMVLMPVMDFLDSTQQGMFLAIFISTLIGALLFLVPMIIFSYRWGRPMSFSIVLLIASLPAFITTALLKSGSLFSFAKDDKDIFSFIGKMGDVNFGLFLGLVITASIILFISAGISLITRTLSKKPADAKK